MEISRRRRWRITSLTVRQRVFRLRFLNRYLLRIEGDLPRPEGPADMGNYAGILFACFEPSICLGWNLTGSRTGSAKLRIGRLTVMLMVLSYLFYVLALYLDFFPIAALGPILVIRILPAAVQSRLVLFIKRVELMHDSFCNVNNSGKRYYPIENQLDALMFELRLKWFSRQPSFLDRVKIGIQVRIIRRHMQAPFQPTIYDQAPS